MEKLGRVLVWDDEELVLVRRPGSLGEAAGLERRAVPHAGPRARERLSRELTLASLLEPAWAVRASALHQGEEGWVLSLEGAPRELLARHLDRPWPIGEFLELALGLVTALAELHARGLVHRDLRPANVFFEPAGRVWLSGFGLAGPASSSAEEELAIAPAYMAPEQTGRLGRGVDFRSDLYALGVMFHELLSGRLPFLASTPAEWVHAHLARTPVPLGVEVPPGLADVVARLLAKAPEDRYPSARSLRADLSTCDAAWRAQRYIARFPLGSRDDAGRLVLSHQLYGRASEQAALRAALEAVRTAGASRIVVVSGPSGIGKSALARALRNDVEAAGGLFASGKLDQLEARKPYGPLVEALGQLVEHVLAGEELTLASIRERLREAAGANGQLLVDCCPEARALLGAQPAPPPVSTDDAKRRFHGLIERTLAVFARPGRPLVLFIDDLQWLDEATLSLLVHLTSRAELRHVLFVLAHRDEAGSPSFQHALAELGERSSAQRLALGALSPDDVAELLRGSLGGVVSEAAELAQLVWEKTGGNPFFTTQFLTTLVDDGWLLFRDGDKTWHWDRAAIAQRGFTENVVEFMLGKLERLAAPTTQVLSWLSCLGRRAHGATLAKLAEDTPAVLDLALEPAVRGGLVFAGEQGYELCHDRVQEALYSRLSNDERVTRHLRIARLLAADEPALETSDLVFQAVDQFRRARSFLTEPEERRRVAELGRTAASRARGAAAYGVALEYASFAAELLTEDAWRSDYSLKVELELLRAESLLLTGSREIDAVLSELAQRAVGPIDRASVTCLRAGSFIAKNLLSSAIEVCLDYLAAAGQRIARQPSDAEVQAEYDALRDAIARRHGTTLAELPLATSPEWSALMSVFEALLPAAAFSDRNLFDWGALRVVNLSIAGGNSVPSSIAYSHMALTLAGRFGDSALALQFGEVARTLVERPGFERYHARVLIVLAYHVLPWTTPLWEALTLMRRTKREAFEQGDFTYVGFAGVHLVQLGVAAASPLAEVLADAERELAEVRDAEFGFLADCHASLLTLVQALRGDRLPPRAGEEDGAVPSVPIARCWHWLRRMQACVFFAEAAEALRCKRLAEELASTSRTHYDFAELTFFGGVAEAWAGDLERAEADLRQYERWAERSPMTFGARASLLAGEVAHRKGRALEAMQLFERAATQARASGLVHDEALACERAAVLHEAAGLGTSGRALYGAARRAYERWGATGKLQRLPHGRDASATSGPLGRADLTTVVEMGRAVAGEIDLDRMVERLLALATERAAATRGLLLLPGSRGFRIEAECRSGEAAAVTFRRAAVSSRELPESVFRYVTRTLRPVVLDDAGEPSQFSADEYLETSRVRSVFCLPLVNQGKLSGVLYLENALVAGAFTDQHVEVLQLLGSHAAVSLENAALFARLRRAELASSEAQRLSQTGSFRFDETTGELELSDEARRIYGLASDDAFSLDEYFSRAHPEDRERVRSEMQERLRHHQPFHAEHRLLLPDGTKKHVRVLAHSIANDPTQGGEWAFAVMDVTASTRAEQAAALAKADLAHAMRVTTLGELTASLAHEIKQPITGALTNAKASARWLAREPADLVEARAATERMVRDVTRASDIVARVGLLFRKRALPPEIIDVRALIAETLGIMQSEAARHAIVIRSALSAELPGVRADRVQLQQVLVNLVMNGIDALKEAPGPRELSITSERLEGRVVVAVADNGPGFAADDADRLFDPFFTTKDHGTGMGLSISRTLVESHGGKLWAAARAGGGAVFQFSLPSVERLGGA